MIRLSSGKRAWKSGRFFRLKTKCRIRGTRESNRSDFVASALKSNLIAEHQI